ncbi:MAG: DNA repair protein RadC [Lentisphaeria bacterium]|nr:DNA repair protein RadC [Lentisphaeria bacterium]
MYDGATIDTGVGMIAEMPQRERPRERLLKRGVDALSDTELLAILLRCGRRGRSVLALAGDVLSAFGGDLGRLSVAAVPELTRVSGIGQAKAVELHAAFGLGRRMAEQREGETPVLDSPACVARFLTSRFSSLRQEEFHALLLDTKNRLLKDCLVTLGLVDRSLCHPREVFRHAIAESATRVLLAHNHPSGDPTPSAGDIQCTTQLAKAGEIIGIQVVDHVIVGGRPRDDCPPFISFQEKHLL